MPSSDSAPRERATKRRTLTGRVFAVLFLLSFTIMACSVAAATAASFAVYEADAEELLLDQATSYAEAIADEDVEGMRRSLGELPFVDTRCTLVAKDGSILFDNYAEPSSMGSHADREEIVEARQGGKKALSRHSQTLGSDVLYAAAPVRDGIVLRLGEMRTSLASFVAGIAGQLAVSIVVIFIVALVASRLLAKMIVRPLREVDFSNPGTSQPYSELEPLVDRIDAQRLELEEKNRELERAVVLRREFASNVSHEMKTPLQVIGGYAELMKEGLVSDDDVPRFAGLIQNESESMRALIDDVLVLSRLDERLGGDAVEVALAPICRRVVERLSSAADERSVAIEMALDESVRIVGDPALVEQMAYNLVDNAIKYNRIGGSVHIGVSACEGRALMTVEDEGPGVPEELRDRIFERFYRIDASRSRDTGGTGLGLAIVKHTAETLGGSVDVSDASAPSGGACFTVSLPLSPTGEQVDGVDYGPHE